MLILSAAGATYMFGLYSSDIKTSLGYDQTTLNQLSFFKDLGSNVGILSGLINEISPPWVVLSIGAVLNFFGYFMIWMSVTKKVSTPKVWLMCLYICIGANSQSFANTGALVTPKIWLMWLLNDRFVVMRCSSLVQLHCLPNREPPDDGMMACL
ncbi:hypothetical protein BC332_29418 [Capsicum chinense]|nr:hypothetical protein BC332_29418 [Capsicum chinense]